MTRRRAVRRALRVFQVCGLTLAAGFLPFIPAGAQETTTLGFYTLRARAAPVYETYEQPSAPIPADPTQEVSVGHAQFDLENGACHGVASALWPGSTAANAPSAIHDVDPRFPLLPNYPVRAEAFFPAGEGQPSTQALDAGAYAMRARCGPDSAQASARSTEVEGMLSTGAVSSATSGTVEGDTAVSVARSSVSDVQLAGVITVENITSFAEARTNGEKAEVSGRTIVTGFAIQGVELTVDRDGVRAGDQEAPVPLSGVTDPLNEQLAQAGLQIFVAEPLDSVEGAVGSRSIGGLIITLQPKVLAAHIPPEVLRSLPPEIPLFLTQFDQTITIALGGVSVSAGAAPPVPPPSVPPPPAPVIGGGDAGVPPEPVLDPPGEDPAPEAPPAPASSTERPAGKTLPMALAVAGLFLALASSRALRGLADGALLAAPAEGRCPLQEPA